MASEIRVNKINNRAGLGTITIADTGVVVNGIVTCTEVSGLNVLNIAGVSTFASTLDINGDIDVDGHTNLDNVSVAGVSTFSDVVNVGNNIQLNPSSGNISGTTATFTTATFDDFVDVGSNIKLGNAGVVTATSYRGDGSQLTGIVAGLSTISGVVNVANDLDVDGHTNLDNVSIAGVTTFTGDITANGATFAGAIDANGDLDVDGHTNLDNVSIAGVVTATTFSGSATAVRVIAANSLAATVYPIFAGNGATQAGDLSIKTDNSLTYNPSTGNLTATKFTGDGSTLSNLPAGAPVGGASTNTVFFENDVAVAVNYQVTSNKNAMSAGPIAINPGIAVTVPSGSSWTIV